MKQLLLCLLVPVFSFAQHYSQQEIARFKSHSRDVTIIRDTWGIPHIYGKTDADAVFGLLYAECEENFQQVERNYLEIMGRLGEVDTKDELYQDLEMRLIYDSAAAIHDYKKSPAWFRKLLDAFADGVNYFLSTHPNVKPLVLEHFEPWFPLMYTDGSISPTKDGGITSQDIMNLYGSDNESTSVLFKSRDQFDDPGLSGSNGFAFGPSMTASKHAILYINPHVTFYFRTEVQMVSEQGLNAYGAVTWGQFFVYQGFNAHCGWMHTSSYADVADLYEEKIVKKNDSLFYEYDGKLLPVKNKQVVINYKKEYNLAQRRFTTYSTHHGPVMGSRNGKWLSLKERNRSPEALMQSWLRTKANGFTAFKKIMNMRSNNSNNTVFADDKGNIAYWHGNFIPKRDARLDWSLPVDGTTNATEWKGLHTLDEIVHLYNPASGWIENCNSTPFTAAGNSSSKKENYPVYMAPEGQNFRAVNAIRLLSKGNNLTIDKVIREIGYNHYLSAFEILLPPLVKAYEELPANDSLKTILKEPIELLQRWDMKSSASSNIETIVIEWAYKILQKAPPAKTDEQASNSIAQMNLAVENTLAAEKLNLFLETMKDLEKRFGSWKILWGEVNRYQRNPNGRFDDNQASVAVGIAAATWGSLPSFVSRRFSDTNRRYGFSGNSFIACVEFGKKIKAKTVVTGGQSFDPESKHFNDQAKMFIEGNFKDVWFYKEDLLKHVEKTYHPGEER
jgi:acyl-homoserine-lactone acylase